ncbi:MAG: hypothetical protein HY928_13600 [Elusimicrobia bacterium]|nr:hypothetical protein [Elusimicrobiota bacterium]
MKRLIVFANRTLNELRRRALRLDELSEQGFLVEYWNLAPLCGLYPHEPSEVSRPYIRRFESWGALDYALAEPAIAESVFVPAFIDEPGYYGAFRRLSRSRAGIALPRLYSSPLPSAGTTQTLWGRLSGLTHPGRLQAAVIKRGMAAMRCLGLLRGFDLAIIVGEATRASVGCLPKLPIHHPDFDDWRSYSASDQPLLKGRYAVFLDMFYSGHPDHLVEGLPPVDAERYFKALNSYFTRLERRYGLEVVVAAHPKADYPVNPFEGRKIFRSSTRVLARFCEFALVTFSASMSYVVFGKKPLFFIDSDEMAVVHGPSGQGAWPRMYADLFGARYANIDHPAAEDVEARPVDPAVYEAYIFRHLASRENAARSTAEILGRFLRDEELPS